MNKVKMTDSQSKHFHSQRMGPEPEVSGKSLSGASYSTALSWYASMMETDEARTYLKDFFKSMPEEFPGACNQLDLVPDIWVNRTLAAMTRLILRGASIPDYSYDKIPEIVEMMLSHAKNTNIIPMKDKIREKAGDIIFQLERGIDTHQIKLEFSFLKILRDNKFPVAIVTHIKNYLEPRVDELFDAMSGDIEGYDSYSEDELAEITGIYSSILTDCNTYLSGVTPKQSSLPKKPRKPRKKKVKTAKKILEHFKYKSSYLRINSLYPEKILGASELWTFNTKNNVLSVFKAADTQKGLSVNRTSISGYDESKSVAKRIGRNTKAKIQEILSCGKVALRKVMETLPGEDLPVTRLNDSTILLRIEK
jgi:hypothetical protein